MRISDAVRSLDEDVRAMFGTRVRATVAYGRRAGTDAAQSALVVVDRLTPEDLRACADRVAAWHDAGLDTPLLLASDEFDRSLDVFPLEFGAIMSDHVLVSGRDPFDGLRVDPSDLRRACEIQVRSHLLHLREGFIETQGRSDEVAALIARSAAPLAALLASVARLHELPSCEPQSAAAAIERTLDAGGEPFVRIVAFADRREPSPDEARRLLPSYIDAMQRLAHHVDSWR
jgi:hypothetical protein